MKLFFIKIKKKIKGNKKIISTLIARDKLPVHTILEPHAPEFVMGPREYNYLDDLKHSENKEQKKQKIIGNMIKQKHLYIKNKDRMVNHQLLYQNQPDYSNLLYVTMLNGLSLLLQLRMVKKNEY